MDGKVFPRLDVLGADGATVLAVVGMDGAAPFDAALAGLNQSPVPAKARESGETRPDLADDDPALAPFALLQELAAEVRMTFGKPGLVADLARAQVVLLGERHDRADMHRWQLHVAAALAAPVA